MAPTVSFEQLRDLLGSVFRPAAREADLLIFLDLPDEKVPDNPAWVFFTIFPLSAPVEVIMRLGVSAIPAWQLVVSIAVLTLSIIGTLLLTIRIFRTYLLMYGKRPGIREVIRNLRTG